MTFVLTEVAEGHTHNRYFESKEEAVAEMNRLVAVAKTVYPVFYTVWSNTNTGYGKIVHAKGVREEGEPTCVLCGGPTASKFQGTCDTCMDSR